ncbi:cyanase [Sulfuracidifex tepidarius]|uniref:Cyanate hydratase n=1 Tax=Sulfuracidifex tepidarius TaxID=1294262 RepID=A0A510DXT1_9CREN|nr:cyanase [Sulfuracidifex tepidarius]BBG25031.1 Cyanate hydratase [Sulfuracidifex tepidarius]BBG27815.1 Cyanate hydratase [Sulfuracidifex tepidarius]
MLDKSKARDLMLQRKREKKLTWEEISKHIGRSPVYTSMLLYGYGQATEEEAEGLVKILELPPEYKEVLMDVPMRTPSQPWPPTDPFVYRLYEAVLLYGPAIKDVAHEMFGDGIMSMIDVMIDVDKVKDEKGNERMLLKFNGKWLKYSRW